MKQVIEQEIQTPHLFLRAWRDSDREPFAKMNADHRVTKYLPSSLSPSESDAFVDRLIEHHKVHGYTFWAVEVCEPMRGSQRGTSPFVGFVGLQQPRYSMPFEHEQPLVEVGWRLAPEWWGLGIATEAAAVSLTFAWNALKLNQVVSYTVPPNLPSQAVMQRIGMSYVGMFNHPDGGLKWWAPHALYRARRGLNDTGARPNGTRSDRAVDVRQQSLTGVRPRMSVSVADSSVLGIPAQWTTHGDFPERRR